VAAHQDTPTPRSQPGSTMLLETRSELEEEISEFQRKIAELDPFKDDPKIEKIITAFRNQIARCAYKLSLL
jgi:hypothetical protein